MVVRKPPHHAQAEPERQEPLTLLERAVPATGIHADRPHLDPMLLRIADELGGLVEAHRLRIEQGRAEDVGMIMLHP